MEGMSASWKHLFHKLLRGVEILQDHNTNWSEIVYNYFIQFSCWYEFEDYFGEPGLVLKLILYVYLCILVLVGNTYTHV